MSKIRIRGMSATKTEAILYLEDGSMKKLLSSDYRTAEILKEITPRLAKREIVAIDLDDYALLRRVEEKSGGVLRFFKRVKDALLGRKSDDPVQVIGQTDEVEDQPITDPRDLAPNETLVVEVDGQKVAGVETLTRHIENAVTTERVKGLTKFMKRMAAVAKIRQHSAEDLLKFMEKADLPIADDGSIVAYKRVVRQNDGFVDTYTERVFQKPGDIVQMPESMVDADRYRDCSHGLHVARRDYLRNFSGDAVLLIRVRPEDVIAVPAYDRSKMRVARYEILAELTDGAKSEVCRNQPITDAEGKALLGRAIEGRFPSATHVVEIRGEQGTNLTRSKIGNASAKVVDLRSNVAAVHSLDDETAVLKPINTREIIQTVREVQQNKDEILKAAMTGSLAAAVSEPDDTDLDPEDETISGDLEDECDWCGNPTDACTCDDEEEVAVEPEPVVEAPVATSDPEPAPEPQKPAKTLGDVKTDISRGRTFPADEADLSDAYKSALKASRDGKAKRAVERETGVSARTVGRLIELYGK